MERGSLPIYFSVPFPAVNGITTYSMYLARGLARLGYPTRILLTESDTTLATYHEHALEIAPDVRVERLPVGRLDGWGAHWGALIRVLHQNAPCVYVPNSDFRHSVVSPLLGPEVLVVGVAHADEPLHYDHVARLGRYWNRIVCVSREVSDQLRARHPHLAERLVVIRNGVEAPSSYPPDRRFDGRLQLVYHGSFKQQQKRVLHFPELLRCIRARGVDARLTLIGSGPDEEALRELGRDLIAAGALVIDPPLPNQVLRDRLRDFHVYLLNSEFEGMPQALLEAMSQGCVPVVTNVSSGTREVVTDGVSGYLVGVSDFDAFADRVAVLDQDRARLEAMSKCAFETLAQRGLRVEDMARSYDELLVEVSDEQVSGRFHRTPGALAAPPVSVDGLSVFPVPLPVEHPRHGRFPSWGDVEDFEWELLCEGRGVVSRQRERPTFLAVRDLGSSYSTELAIELAAFLHGRGYDARLLCLRPPPEGALTPPEGVPVETVCASRDVGWAGASERALGLVANHGECSYVAFDRDAACLAPRLASRVRTMALANHADVTWLRASELPNYLDGLALTSPAAEAEAFPNGPPLSLRVAVMSYPVHALAESPTREPEPLVILAYLGHLDGRVPDAAQLRPVLAALASSDVAMRVLVPVPIGTPAHAREVLGGLPGALRVEVVEVASGAGLRRLFAEAHLLLLPKPFEDVSLAVLEALGHGCVPVGPRSPGLEHCLPKGLDELLVEDGDPAALALRIRELAAARGRVAAIAEQLRAHVATVYASPEAVGDRWVRMLARVWDAAEHAELPRTRLGVRHREHPVWLAVRELASGYSAELALDLAACLRAEGYEVRLLCLWPPQHATLAVPDGVSVETVCDDRDAPWADASASALEIVDGSRSCSYAAFDRDTATLAPRLASTVRSLVLANTQDAAWLRASEIPRYVDGVVLSSAAAEKRVFPKGAPPPLRVSCIPYPVHFLDAPRAQPGGPLAALAYFGHLDGREFEVEPVCALAASLADGRDRMRLVVAVPPDAVEPTREALQAAGAEHVELAPADGCRSLRDWFEQSELLLLPVPFEDVSLVVLEALGHGCVPVGVRSASLDSLLGELASGLVEGNVRGLARRALALAASRERVAAIGERIRAHVAASYPGPDEVASRWIELLARIWDDAEFTQVRRSTGPLFPPYPDLSVPGALRRLVRVRNVGTFVHWYEWLEFRTGATFPRRIALALARFARRRRGARPQAPDQDRGVGNAS